MEESGKKVNSAGSEGGKGLELLKTGAGVAAGAIAAVAGAAVAVSAQAVNLSDDLTKAMNGFSAATGLGVDEAKKYEETLNKILETLIEIKNLLMGIDHEEDDPKTELD